MIILRHDSLMMCVMPDKETHIATTANSVLGQNVAFLIKDAQLTYRAAAKLAGINERTMKFIVDTRNSPSITVIEKIAKAFRVEVWMLSHPDLEKLHKGRKKAVDLLHIYAECSKESRGYIERAADQETRYDRINTLIGGIVNHNKKQE